MLDMLCCHRNNHQHVDALPILYIRAAGHGGLPLGTIGDCIKSCTMLQCKKTNELSFEEVAFMNERVEIKEERISAKEYIDFLKRTDLGAQYPRERFEERIEKLVCNASISLVARNENGTIVGVLFGLTDYAYWLYITDLGVDRTYERRGIGRRLMKTAHEKAGGEHDIGMYLIANDKAIPFYEKLGMEKADDVMQYNHIDWTYFVVE